MHTYYYIIASLPEITLEKDIDDSVFEEAFALIHRNLSDEDLRLFYYLQYPSDIHTIVNALAYNKKVPQYYPLIISPPTLTKEQAGKIITYSDPAPEFIQKVFEEDRDWPEEPIFEIERILTEAFYIAVLQENDEFLKAYFSFDKNLKNIITAFNGRQYQFDSQQYFIDHNPVHEQLKRDHSADFGLADQFPFVDTLSTKIAGDDPIALEMYLDKLKWDFIEDLTRPYFFTRQNIFGYFIKLQMAFRWSKFRSVREEKKIIDLLTTGALEQFKFSEFLESI